MRKLFLMLMGILLMATGCANLREEAALPVEDVFVEDGVYRDSDRVYRYGQRTVFEDIEPMITEEVSPEDFWAIYSEADSFGEAVPCVYRTMIKDDRMQDVGLFRVEKNLKFGKICTYEDCRKDKDAYCDHLIPFSLSAPYSAVWYGDSMYLVARYKVPGESRVIHNYMILRWQEGADHFEKIFESQLYIQDIHVSGGLMYLFASDNFGSGTNGYYILNLEYLVYTAVETANADAAYLFGENHIVMYDRNGTHAVNSVLNTGMKLLDKNMSGQIDGDYYWYDEYVNTQERTLYRMDLNNPGEKEKVLDKIRYYAVCGETLFYEPSVSSGHQILFDYRNSEMVKGEKIYDEGLTGYSGHTDRKIMRVRLFDNGTLGTPSIAAQTGQNEWMGSAQAYLPMGDFFLYRTVTPGNQQDIKWYEHTYIADWQNERKFSESIQK